MIAFWSCLLVLAGCGGSATPEDVVRDLYGAVAEKDGERACDLVTVQARQLLDVPPDPDPQVSRAACVEIVSRGTSDHLQGVELIDAETTGEQDTSASVDADINSDGEELSITFDLIKVDDEWLVDGPVGADA